MKKIHSSLTHDETVSNNPPSLLGRDTINLWPSKLAAVK